MGKSTEAWSSKTAAEWTKAFADELKTYKYTNEHKAEGWSARVPDSAAVMRFVRARKGDLAAAVDQCVNAEYFRYQHRAETITEPDPIEPVYSATCPHLNAGWGRKGEPLYFERTGVIDQPELLKHSHPKDLVWRHVRQMELFVRRCEEKTEELGKNVEKQIIISDLKGLSLWPNRRAFAVFKETIHIDQTYYPERLKAMYFINAPLIFRPIWAAVRPWLDPVTKDKFHVLGSNYQEALLEKISPENLPEEYGGTMKQGIPNLVPLTPEQTRVSQERVKDIEAGDTSLGHFVSGQYPPGAELPFGGVAPAHAPRAAPAKAAEVAEVALSPTPAKQPSQRPRGSPPWVIHGEGGSIWV